MESVRTSVESRRINEIGESDSNPLKPLYIEAVSMIELLHRRLLDVIKDEFERIGQTDVNAVQALLLFNISDSELTAGELRNRGYYLGSNVSYNLKKLVDLGYINQAKSEVDRRTVRIRLTKEGLQVCQMVNSLYERHLASIEHVGGISRHDFETLTGYLKRLERFWTDQIRFRL